MIIGFSGLGQMPSHAQFRFMTKCWGNKPHIDFIKGEWRCVGQHIYAYGATKFVAHANWQHESEARAEWESRR